MVHCYLLMNYTRGILVLLLLLLTTCELVEDMDDDVGESIFHDGKIYLIYVYNNIKKE